MSKTIIIYHPDTLKGFACAYALWFGLCVAIDADKERPDVVFTALGNASGVTADGDNALVIYDWNKPHNVWVSAVADYPVPDVLRYVEDITHALPNSKEVRAFLATMGRTAEALEEWVEFDRFQACVAGAAILRFNALPRSEQADYLYEEVTEETKTCPHCGLRVPESDACCAPADYCAHFEVA